MGSVPPGRVVRAAAGDAGVRVQVELIAATIQRLEAGTDQQRIAARVGDVGVGDAVLRRRTFVRIRNDILERVFSRHRNHMTCRIAFEIDECRPVRDDVLHVLHVRDVETRIEDLARDPLRNREPDFAVDPGRRADGKLVSRRPGCRAARTIACGDCRHPKRFGLGRLRPGQHERQTESALSTSLQRISLLQDGAPMMNDSWRFPISSVWQPLNFRGRAQAERARPDHSQGPPGQRPFRWGGANGPEFLGRRAQCLPRQITLLEI